mmetsp:Transcript_2356/g.5011  ORF Transcript_2356/g.5011 Transcript_2356/m.5011 type:complete len:252 (-) Transcript_2356:548-1303(-)
MQNRHSLSMFQRLARPCAYATQWELRSQPRKLHPLHVLLSIELLPLFSRPAPAAAACASPNRDTPNPHPTSTTSGRLLSAKPKGESPPHIKRSCRLATAAKSSFCPTFPTLPTAVRGSLARRTPGAVGASVVRTFFCLVECVHRRVRGPPLGACSQYPLLLLSSSRTKVCRAASSAFLPTTALPAAPYCALRAAASALNPPPPPPPLLLREDGTPPPTPAIANASMTSTTFPALALTQALTSTVALCSRML